MTRDGLAESKDCEITQQPIFLRAKYLNVAAACSRLAQPILLFAYRGFNGWVPLMFVEALSPKVPQAVWLLTAML